jgi:hypothetical protein
MASKKIAFCSPAGEATYIKRRRRSGRKKRG